MTWMIYGANGYTGRLLVAECVRRGLAPMLAGRDANAVGELAAAHGLLHRVFPLDDPATLATGIEDMQLVLHAAGPFSRTSAPMLAACLDAGTHYLDITGEIDVFEAAWRRSDDAARADIVVCPGAGFDVTPTDCLAAALVRALPSATRLTLAFEAGGGLSPGTAKTGVENLGRGGRIRRDGELVSVPVAWKTRDIPFAHATRTAVTIPWGDVFTAWVSTGVPNIEVYLSAPPSMIRRMRWARYLQAVLATDWFRRRAQQRIARTVLGPDDESRANSQTQIWGEATSEGRSVAGTMSGPNGYDFTVLAALGIVEHLLANEVEGGYYTPSLLMGPDYAASLPGVSMSIDV
jgi:short subunit dehydrogenase-like uncharacterized protein